MVVNDNNATAAAAADDDEDEEDPLDAFMADISERAKTTRAEPKVRCRKTAIVDIWLANSAIDSQR